MRAACIRAWAVTALLAAVPYRSVFAQGIEFRGNGQDINGAVKDGVPDNESAPAPIGSGVIRGTVVNAKTSEPLKKARVTLSGPASMSAVTDSSGMFTFRALPPGGYMVMANHDDFYVNPATQNFNRQVNLADGEEKQGVEIKLMPGATITGRVLDEDDAPVGSCSVTTSGHERTGPLRRPYGVFSFGNTDDQGRYRLHSIQQGHYVLTAYCGTTYPAAHGFMKRNDPMIPREGYALATLGGGDPDAKNAGINVTAGAELTGLDFHVTRVPVYLVQGTISGGDASALPGVQLTLTPQDPALRTGQPARGHYNQARGTFTFEHVPAGTYDLNAMLFTPGQGQSFQARETVEVGKATVTHVDLKLTPGSVITGRVDIDDPNLRMDNMQIALQPVGEFQGAFPAGVIGPDGRFELKPIMAGTYQLNPLPMGYVKSMTLGGQEVSPMRFTIAEGSTGPLNIVIGSKMAKLEIDLTPAPAAGDIVSAMLIPDGAEETVGTIRNIGVASAGKISFGSVPPGKYRIFVAQTANLWNVANQLEQLKPLESHMVPVELAEGDDKHVTAETTSADDLQRAMEASE